MKNWQKDRNYRKYKNADGSITYMICIDGVNINVSAEVFKAYSQADRRERYCAEREKGKILSLDRMGENNSLLSHLLDQYVESVEDTVIRAAFMKRVESAFQMLNREEQHLLQAVVINGVTEQAYADIVGVTQVTIHKRKKRALKKIFNLVGY